MTSSLELSYSHQITTKTLNRKCTLCHKATTLMRLPEEFQEHATKKGFESFYCVNCITVVNFLLI